MTHDFTDLSSAKFHKIWTQQLRSVRRWKLSEQDFENITARGRFSKKTQKFLNKFSGLATSGRHNSAMITDRPKLTIKVALYGMSSTWPDHAPIKDGFS